MQRLRTFDELRKIIEDRYDKLGADTKQNPIDFNDIECEASEVRKAFEAGYKAAMKGR